jgi:hypothetical protein
MKSLCSCIAAAALLAAPGASFAQTCADPEIEMKALVLAQSGTESWLAPITETLQMIGMPYEVLVRDLGGAPIAAQLADGCQARYQAIFTTSGDILYDPAYAALWQYAAQFGIRTVNLYSWPYPDYGFGGPIAGAPTATGLLTAAGRSAFRYLNPDVALHTEEWTYLAPAGSGTALLQDAAGNALVATSTLWDGREFLTLTFPAPVWRMASWQLAYGMVRWATRGLLLGERHIYLAAQVDDFFIPDDIWLPSTACSTATDQTGASYRMSRTDLEQLVAWQDTVRSAPLSPDFTLSMAFNGEGAEHTKKDTLTPALKTLQSSFNWINHTYDHQNLDAIGYKASVKEITENERVARKLKLDNFTGIDMVTPDVSGLTNPLFLAAARDRGIRYLVTDTSRPGYDNPTPNAGIVNPIEPSILMIPRHANNLFYNVSTPQEWEAEYRCIYAAQPPYATYTYEQILADQTDLLLFWMVKGNIDPLMFHQANLRAFDGTNSLLGRLIDSTLARYRAMFNLPVASLRMDQIGGRMEQRMAYDAARVRASFVPGKSITLRAEAAAVVPVTGLQTAGAEVYGGEVISHVNVAAGAPVTLPLQ